MKLIIAFLIIGSFAILETAAEPLCVCPRSPRQYVRQQYSLPRNYRFGQKAIAESDNEEPSLLAIVSGDKDNQKRESSGDGSRTGPRAGESQSQPSRLFSIAESSQPEYVDLDDIRFLYGNYQG